MERRIHKKIQEDKEVGQFKTPDDFDDPYEFEAYLLALMLNGYDNKISIKETTWLIRSIMDEGLDPAGAYELGLDVKLITDTKISDEQH